MTSETKTISDRLIGIMNASRRYDEYVKKAFVADTGLTDEQHVELVGMTGRGKGSVSRVVAAG